MVNVTNVLGVFFMVGDAVARRLNPFASRLHAFVSTYRWLLHPQPLSQTFLHLNELCLSHQKDTEVIFRQVKRNTP